MEVSPGHRPGKGQQKRRRPVGAAVVTGFRLLSSFRIPQRAMFEGREIVPSHSANFPSLIFLRSLTRDVLVWAHGT